MQNELFPREVISNVPRITLTGHDRLHIEQHKGLVAYSPEEIILRTAVGLMRVNGTELRFSLYDAGEALVSGCIVSVGYVQKEERP